MKRLDLLIVLLVLFAYYVCSQPVTLTDYRRREAAQANDNSNQISSTHDWPDEESRYLVEKGMPSGNDIYQELVPQKPQEQSQQDEIKSLQKIMNAFAKLRASRSRTSKAGAEAEQTRRVFKRWPPSRSIYTGCDHTRMSVERFVQFLRTGRICGYRVSRIRYGLSG